MKPASEFTRETPSQPPPEDAGFTIVELLVSLMILVMIMSLLPGALRLGHRVWENDEKFERHAAISSFQRMAEQRLAETIPVHLRDAVQGQRLDFLGAPDRVAFIAPVSAGPAGGGVYRFELTLTEDHALVLRQSLYRPDGAYGPSVQHVASVSVAALTFRYFGAPQLEQPPQWRTQWTRQDALPDLIEISVTTDEPVPQAHRSVVELRMRPTR